MGTKIINARSTTLLAQLLISRTDFSLGRSAVKELGKFCKV